MSGSHGDLFREIGALVVAAHGGNPIDLNISSEDLAARYINLGVPADTIARAIARSLGAVSMSMAIVSGKERPIGEAIRLRRIGDRLPAMNVVAVDRADEAAPEHASANLFPSGVRLAVLS